MDTDGNDLHSTIVISSFGQRDGCVETGRNVGMVGRGWLSSPLAFWSRDDRRSTQSYLYLHVID